MRSIERVFLADRKSPEVITTSSWSRTYRDELGAVEWRMRCGLRACSVLISRQMLRDQPMHVIAMRLRKARYSLRRKC